jgi:hypothetical protein
MADKTLLVIGSDGLPQQLQAGDRPVVAISANDIRNYTNGESSAAIAIGAPVYASAAGTVKLAKANAKATSGVVGLGYDVTTAFGATGNIQCSGVMIATTGQWDSVITGGSGGLTFNTLYFLDPAAFGKLTATPPTTVGYCNVLIGRAISTTELALALGQPILL